jgi:Rad3-related DNA helicase/serine/threonine protein kinase
MAEVELQQIGDYSVTGLLRVSSTSNFYLGTHRKKKILIQKLTIPITDPDDKKAFLTHARQLKKLTDRTIIAIIDAKFDGDYGYLIMEQPDGEPLNTQVKASETLAPDQAKRYLTPLATALHQAHLRNLVHGNLHPGCILVSNKSEVRLGAFALTPPGTHLHLEDEHETLPYMAPEQLQEQQPTSASDQYTLAVILYEWLCGKRPYQSSEREQLLALQQQCPQPSLREHNKKVSEAAEKVVQQALALDPQQRFPHIQAFSTAYLSALMGIPIKTPEIHVVKQSTAPQPLSLNITNTKASIVQEEQEQTEPFPEEQRAPQKVLAEKSTKASTHLTKATLKLPVIEDFAPARVVRREEKPVALPAPPPMTPLNIEDDDDDDAPTIISNSRLVTRVAEDLRQGGVLSQSLPGYEERPAQIEMATLVSQAINHHTHAIIEAATGTGKSLAYLVPVVRSGQVAIISTANKALQEQLYYKDIPFVQKHIKPFEAALVKGVNNYICLDRVENERMNWQILTKNRDFQRLYDYINDPETGIDFDGDFETLGFQLPGDIRGRVATDSDQCAWTKCSYFEDCYVHDMRARAERAQVIVVNHTLLLLDAQIGGFLLPERDMIILDEAHHLEEEATRSFTITIAPARIQTLLAQRMLKDHSQMSLQDDTMRAAQLLWARLEQLVIPSFKGRTNLEEPIEEGLRLATAVSDLADSMRKQRPKDLPDKEGQLYDKLLKRAQNLAEELRTVFSVAEKNKFVYYAERTENSVSRGIVIQASAAPLDVTSWLRERLFDKYNVISTSATLATVSPNPVRPEEKGPNFTYFRSRVGLNTEEHSEVMESILPLTFDYENNALLYLPRNLPVPTFGAGSEAYMKDIAREMYRLVKLSRGRAFLLFSSKRMLDYAYDLMAPHLSDYPLLKQGDMTRLELTRRFREEKGSVLFGLKSFWEGVDIAGDALSLVVIDKLPFDPPDDPVHEARVTQMKAAGENWFGTYVLPQAVLRLKQGIGRLLRTREDRGVMAILDTRLHTKGYGRMVLDALPPARRTSNIKDIRDFFAEDGYDQ